MREDPRHKRGVPPAMGGHPRPSEEELYRYAQADFPICASPTEALLSVTLEWYCRDAHLTQATLLHSSQRKH